MNDLTKEELEDILNWADVYTQLGTCWTYKIHESLIGKIKAMIENYCEHDYRMLSPVIVQCYKCGTGHILNE